MLDRAVIEKVGAGLGLAIALALLVKMLLPHARRVQVDLWLHTQRLRLRRRLRPFWRPSSAQPASGQSAGDAVSHPAGGSAGDATAVVPPPVWAAPSGRRPASPARPLPLRSLRRRCEGEWSGNVFHLRTTTSSRQELH